MQRCCVDYSVLCSSSNSQRSIDTVQRQYFDDVSFRVNLNKQLGEVSKAWNVEKVRPALAGMLDALRNHPRTMAKRPLDIVEAEAALDDVSAFRPVFEMYKYAQSAVVEMTDGGDPITLQTHLFRCERDDPEWARRVAAAEAAYHQDLM